MLERTTLVRTWERSQEALKGYLNNLQNVSKYYLLYFFQVALGSESEY